MYDKFKKLLDENNVTPYRVSKDTGISTTTLTKWKQGEYTPKKDKIKLIASYFDVPMSYFYDDEQTYEISAGNGRINESTERFKPSQGRIARVVGDSMLPTLKDGDYVHIVEIPDVTPQDYAVLRINGDEMTIKHVEFTEDGMWVRGENKEVFEDKFYTIKDIVLLPIQVVGKADEIIQRKL